MFTGLVEEVGTVSQIDERDGGVRVWIDATVVVEDAEIGDSIAVDGACLTVVELTPTGFAIEAVAETLRRTTLGKRHVGDAVNLERALAAAARLGGHIVQGHIDGTGTVAAITPEGAGLLVRIETAPEILRYVVEKGSITVDGISLTVAGRDEVGFTVALIPHTIEATTIGRRTVGDPVNLEVDLVAKYVEAFTDPYHALKERT